MIDCKLLQKNGLLAVAFVSGLAICASGRAAQEQTFDWQVTNDQSVRLDPSGYHTGQVFKSSDQVGDRVGNVHVDIEAQEPITVEMAPTGEWSEALRHPELLPRISFRCIREHVMKMTYACEVPAGRPMTLVVRDERDGGRTANIGFGAGADDHGTVRDFVAPNDIHINYYRWACVENCSPPQYQWTTELKERYELTRAMKVYDGIAADRDGEPFSVKVSSPVPMTVAIVPTRVAERARAKGSDIDGAVGSGNCTQRGAQSGTFECTFDVSDGPLSLVAAPEGGNKLGSKEKAEVEVEASKCVANCLTPIKQEKADSDN